MHVFLTGASGFIGSYVLPALLEAGHSVRCLVRNRETPLIADAAAIERVKGDVTDPRSMAGTMRGCDAVIHLVGIIEEQPARGITFQRLHADATANVIAEAKDAEIDRFVHMSANGADQQGVSAYQRSKWEAEQHVTQAGFPHWCIFRPSIVFGKPKTGATEFATRLVHDLIKPFPILPVFGDGTYRLQPIAVEALAAAMTQAVTREKASGNIYCAAGPEAFTYLEILDRITRGSGRAPKPKLHQPVWLVRPIVQTAGKIGLLPITPDQFEMLLQGNTCDITAFTRDFDTPEIPFDTDQLAYLKG